MSSELSFFIKTRDKSVLQRVEFYAQDIRILKDLGFDVHIVTTPHELKRADIYFVWWWTWAFFPLMASILYRRPILITGVFDEWAFSLRPWWHKLLMKLALQQATANVFLSQLEYQKMTEKFKVNNPYYCPLCVDTNVYTLTNKVKSNTIFTVAWLQGSNADRKCIAEIIKAAKLVCDVCPTVRFLIAGEQASAYPRLAKLVEELEVSDQIEFMGIVSKEQKISLMQSSKIYLQPSRFEGFGLAVLEAMSCGSSIITSPVGNIPELVDDTAIFVDGTDPESIAQAVIKLIKDNNSWQGLGERARTRATTVFAYERRRDKLEQIIKELKLNY